ncbi:MAG TPA: hypothetical protein VIU36_02660 [Gammaproteobacteria bacterium]|jgi:hypothetical protein
MQLPTSQPDIVSQMLDNLIEVLQPLTLSERSSENAAQNPVELVASLGQLREIVQNNTTSQLTPGEVTEIGDFSMQLLGSTSAILQRMNNVELQQQNGLLAVSMALWTSANGGQINMLEPLVDTLAWLANHIEDTRQLVELTRVLGSLMEACSIAISSDLDNTNPGRPWRVLNINRGIVATRSHDTRLMHEVFETLIRNLPQDAASFFQQGMSEMDRLGYPDHVRKVMQEYAEQYPVNKVVH